MTQKIYIYRGLPASGKSTDAEVRMNVMRRKVVRIERDLLRDQLYGNRYYQRPEHWNMTDEEFKIYLSDRENTITSIQFAMAEEALKAGKSVITSDTNLSAKVVKAWIALADKYGVEYEIINFDHIPLDVCIVRDSQRVNRAGEEVIRDMYNRFFKKGKIPEVVVNNKEFGMEPYVRDTDLPSAILADIDGTIAKMNGRSPYDWTRVGEDSPVQAVIDAISAAYHIGDKIIVMSGRDGSCFDATRMWLEQYITYDELYMRPEGDTRRDDIVKYELFNTHVRNRFNVKYVLDDRQQVVDMWRKLGLNCFQVAPGDF